jgi:hypothetical protein
MGGWGREMIGEERRAEEGHGRGGWEREEDSMEGRGRRGKNG